MKASKPLNIIQGNGITYMMSDMTLVHLKILMTIIKELQKSVSAMVGDIDKGLIRADSVLPPVVEIGSDSLRCRKVTVHIRDLGLGAQNNRYLLECLDKLKEKTCVFPSSSKNPSRSERIIVTGLLSHFSYDRTAQTIDIYLLDIVAKKLLLVRDGFTRYDYNQAMAFVNKYTVRMYWIINSWRGRQGFRISMSQLRYVMSAEDKYPRDDNFIAKVIKVAYEELREKADIWFEFARDCRDGQDIFSFKVYQRLSEQQRKRMLHKPKGDSLYILATCWKMKTEDVNEMISKITADNAIEYLRYLRYVTDVTDIRSLDKPSSYIKKAMNSFLSTLSPIDSHETSLLP